MRKLSKPSNELSPEEHTKWVSKLEAVYERTDLTDDQKNALIAEMFEEYREESFEAYVRRGAAAIDRRSTTQEERQQFVEDYTKVAMAHFTAPPEKKREAMEKALEEVWARRRREKEAKQEQEKKK